MILTVRTSHSTASELGEPSDYILVCGRKLNRDRAIILAENDTPFPFIQSRYPCGFGIIHNRTIPHNRKDDTMGQYHICVSLSKREFLNPHRLGDGLKLWEQGASQGGTLNAIHAVLAVSNGRGGGDYIESDFVGRWGGDRIAIIGDYSEVDDIPGEENAKHIYNACGITEKDIEEYYPDPEERELVLGSYLPGDWTDISDLAREFLSAQWGLEFGDKGWVTRAALPGSPFADVGPPIAPDMIIGMDR